MSAPLSAEENERYTNIIDDILAKADLETISRKKIRQGLQDALGGVDLSEQKDAIKALIEERFDAVSNVTPEPAPSPKKRSNGATSESPASPEPSRKKAKRSESAEDADARLAAQLQEQENSLARGRSTRGGLDKKTKPKKAAARKKKSSNKISTNDDSEVEGSDGEPKKKRKAGGGFQKPFNLSPALADIVGESQLARPAVVKGLWAHIKSNDLQDPNDKRSIVCDAKLYAVFKQAKVNMFSMNKELGKHLYPVEEPPAQA